jgi:DNA-binding response OmpR family regulator
MKKYTILVAEDDPALLRSFLIRLGSQGYEVLCASDGAQAVALAAARRPDMLILDVHLPAGDGFSVQDSVRKMSDMDRVPILYVTGDDSQSLHEMSEDSGVQWLLRKPFSSVELLEVVRLALEQGERLAASVPVA